MVATCAIILSACTPFSVFVPPRTLFVSNLSQILLHSCSAVWWSGVHAVDVKAMFALECEEPVVSFVTSTVEHYNAGLSLPASCAISKNETIGGYYGSLVCSDLLSSHCR